MSVKVTRLEGDQFRAEADGFTVLSGRLDEQTPPIGMSPGKLMVSSLALCSAFHAAWYLKRHKIEASSLQVEVDAMNDKEPSRASGFDHRQGGGEARPGALRGAPSGDQALLRGEHDARDASVQLRYQVPLGLIRADFYSFLCTFLRIFDAFYVHFCTFSIPIGGVFRVIFANGGVFLVIFVTPPPPSACFRVSAAGLEGIIWGIM